QTTHRALAFSTAPALAFSNAVHSSCGDYTVENAIVIPIHEHYSVNASIHEQIKDLPDGTAAVNKSLQRPSDDRV
ncbi:MAG: hypothetical protein O3C40_23750, partial [Planctomycetota bacterium]|nr:hypothetical protein [Planctomycetota bacterium]